MAIFPVIESEDTVQLNDKTRIDATKSFATQDESSINVVKIKASSGEDFISISSTTSSDWYLDWQYSASGTHTITVLVEAGAASASAQFTKTISAVTAASDNLYSNDNDLRVHEPDILQYVPDGRSSFLNIHRRAQELMIDWLNRQGFVDDNANPLTKSAVITTSEVREWSTFLTLKLIFEGLSNAIDDIFAAKAKRYHRKMTESRKRALVRLDLNGDGTQDDLEGLDLANGRVFRA